MRTHGTRIARRIARLTMRNPEQSWQQSGLDLCLFLGMNFAILWLNGSVIERGIAASEGIKLSNQQVLFAQRMDPGAQELLRSPGTWPMRPCKVAVPYLRSWSRFMARVDFTMTYCTPRR
jgi:hypothetical protein